MMVADAPDQKVFYRKIQLKKKNPARVGDFRTVFSIPDRALSDAHKSIARRLELFVRQTNSRYPHPACHGYIVGRSTRTNAEPHCGAHFILHADIDEFFASISRERVQAALMLLGTKRPVASALARFLTIDESLPLGLHSSPLIANLVCLDMDDQMSTLASAHRAVYTRYADDMTFSASSARLPGRRRLEAALRANGFRLSDRKLFTTRIGQSHFVTGLSVSDGVPHVPRRLKRRLRQEIYMAEKHGLKSHLGRAGYIRYGIGVNNISGRLHYLAGVEHALGNRMLSDWNRVLEDNEIEPTFYPRQYREPRNVSFYCDESEVSTSRGSVFLLALVAIEETAAVRQATAKVTRNYLADPFMTGRRDNVRARGLHYTEATEELRTEYVRALADCPFRAYIAMDFLVKHESARFAFLYLLKALVKDRLTACDRALVHFYFENNDSLRLSEIKAAVSSTYGTLAAADSRRPLSIPDVSMVSKPEEPLLAVPDFALGVLGACLSKSRETDIKRFERLRDKFGVIVDRTTGKYFSRFKPFLAWEPS